MFETLYTLLGTPGEYITYEPQYLQDVFPIVGIFTPIVSVLLAGIFYLLVNRMTSKYSGTGHWILSMVLSALIAIIFAISQAKSGTQLLEIDSYMFLFALINAVYAMLVYVLISLLFKKLSIHAERTPF